MFKFSSYWCTWSRVLQRTKDQWIELNLIDMNNDWSTVLNETVRIHCTDLVSGDKLQDTLPIDIKESIEKNVGKELASKLFTYDYLSEINFDKYYQVCNGGAAFSIIKK
jgi:hypothetical protein